GEGRPVPAGPVVGGQSVEGEGVEVDVLAAVRRPALVRHLCGVTAVPLVAGLLFEEVKTGPGRPHGWLLLDAGRRQSAEEPQLAGLEGEELLTGRGEAVPPERLQVAAVRPVHTGRQVEIDDARLEDLPAAAGLRLQVSPRWRPACRWR